ncbi:MAG: hypothetical protein ABIK33_03740 [candidate division WOR-3 bacterium]
MNESLTDLLSYKESAWLIELIHRQKGRRGDSTPLLAEFLIICLKFKELK